MKKRSLLLVALVLFAASLFAAPVVVTWEWMLEDPNVTTFRYQVDGENPDQWIVVDSSVTSYTVKGLDGSQAYTLYLQQSYDGENFSESAKAVSEPISPVEPEVAVAEAEPVVEEVVEPAVVEEAVVMAETEPVPVEEPVAEVVAEPVAEEIVAAEPAAEEVAVPVEAEPLAEPVAEEVAAPVEAEPLVEPVVEEVAPAAVVEAPVAEEKVKADSRFAKTLTLGGGINRMTDPAFASALHTTNLEVELGLQLKNMMTFNKMLGLGVDIGLTYNPYLASSRGWTDAASKIFTDFSGVWADFTQAGTVSVAPMLNLSLGKVAVDLGAGGFFTYGPEFNSSNGDAYMFGAFAKLSLAYQINSWFSMGANAKYNFVLSDLTNKPQFINAGIFLGFSF